jgi:DNA repair ATPase RecN
MEDPNVIAALEATRLQEELERITKAHTKGECVPQHLYDDALAEVAKLREEVKSLGKWMANYNEDVLHLHDEAARLRRIEKAARKHANKCNDPDAVWLEHALTEEKLTPLVDPDEGDAY